MKTKEQLRELFDWPCREELSDDALERAGFSCREQQELLVTLVKRTLMLNVCVYYSPAEHYVLMGEYSDNNGHDYFIYFDSIAEYEQFVCF
jgi:hypothetical protein